MKSKLRPHSHQPKPNKKQNPQKQTRWLWVFLENLPRVLIQLYSTHQRLGDADIFGKRRPTSVESNIAPILDIKEEIEIRIRSLIDDPNYFAVCDNPSVMVYQSFRILDSSLSSIECDIYRLSPGWFLPIAIYYGLAAVCYSLMEINLNPLSFYFYSPPELTFSNPILSQLYDVFQSSLNTNKRIKIPKSLSNQLFQSKISQNQFRASFAFPSVALDDQQDLNSTPPRKIQPYYHVKTIIGHKLPVYNVAFDPSGQRFVTASDSGIVKIWSTTTCTLIHTLIGHNAEITRFCISYDSLFLCTADTVGQIRLWHLSTGWLLGVFEAVQSCQRYKTVIESSVVPIVANNGQIPDNQSDQNQQSTFRVVAPEINQTITQINRNIEQKVRRRVEISGLYFINNSHTFIATCEDGSFSSWTISNHTVNCSRKACGEGYVEGLGKKLTVQESLNDGFAATFGSVGSVSSNMAVPNSIDADDGKNGSNVTTACNSTLDQIEQFFSLEKPVVEKPLQKQQLKAQIYHDFMLYAHFHLSQASFHAAYNLPSHNQSIGKHIPIVPFSNSTSIVIPKVTDPKTLFIARDRPLGLQILYGKMPNYSLPHLNQDLSGVDLRCSCTFDNYVAIGTATGLVYLYKVKNIKAGFTLVDILVGHIGPILYLEFSPNGQMLASCSDDGSIRVWRYEENMWMSVILFEHPNTVPDYDKVAAEAEEDDDDDDDVVEFNGSNSQSEDWNTDSEESEFQPSSDEDEMDPDLSELREEFQDLQNFKGGLFPIRSINSQRKSKRKSKRNLKSHRKSESRRTSKRKSKKNTDSKSSRSNRKRSQQTILKIREEIDLTHSPDITNSDLLEFPSSPYTEKLFKEFPHYKDLQYKKKNKKRKSSTKRKRRYSSSDDSFGSSELSYSLTSSSSSSTFSSDDSYRRRKRRKSKKKNNSKRRRRRRSKRGKTPDYSSMQNDPEEDDDDDEGQYQPSPEEMDTQPSPRRTRPLRSTRLNQQQQQQQQQPVDMSINDDPISNNDDPTPNNTDPTSNEPNSTPDFGPHAVWTCCWSKDSSRIVSCSKQGQLRVWNPKTGHLYFQLTGLGEFRRRHQVKGNRGLPAHTKECYALKSHPLFDWCVVSGSEDGTLIVWNIIKGIMVSRFNIYCVSNLSNENLNSTVDFHLPLLGIALHPHKHFSTIQNLSKESSSILDLAFSPDGSQLIVTDVNGHIHLFGSTSGGVDFLTVSKERIDRHPDIQQKYPDGLYGGEPFHIQFPDAPLEQFSAYEALGIYEVALSCISSNSKPWQFDNWSHLPQSFYPFLAVHPQQYIPFHKCRPSPMCNKLGIRYDIEYQPESAWRPPFCIWNENEITNNQFNFSDTFTLVKRQNKNNSDSSSSFLPPNFNKESIIVDIFGHCSVPRHTNNKYPDWYRRLIHEYPTHLPMFVFDSMFSFAQTLLPNLLFFYNHLGVKYPHSFSRGLKSQNTFYRMIRRMVRYFSAHMWSKHPDLELKEYFLPDFTSVGLVLHKSFRSKKLRKQKKKFTTIASDEILSGSDSSDHLWLDDSITTFMPPLEQRKQYNQQRQIQEQAEEDDELALLAQANHQIPLRSRRAAAQNSARNIRQMLHQDDEIDDLLGEDESEDNPSQSQPSVDEYIPTQQDSNDDEEELDAYIPETWDDEGSDEPDEGEDFFPRRYPKRAVRTKRKEQSPPRRSSRRSKKRINYSIDDSFKDLEELSDDDEFIPL